MLYNIVAFFDIIVGEGVNLLTVYRKRLNVAGLEEYLPYPEFVT